MEFSGVKVLYPKVHRDERGCFAELWNRETCGYEGLPTAFVQDNRSVSNPLVIRGLHFQNPRPQGKLVTCLHGMALDVIVDIRRSSKTFGDHAMVTLEGLYDWHDIGKTLTQLYIPPGFAHGFVALGARTVIDYKVTDYYSPADQYTLAYNDPDLGIDWPKSVDHESAKDAKFVLSDKDASGTRLRDFRPEDLFP